MKTIEDQISEQEQACSFAREYVIESEKEARRTNARRDREAFREKLKAEELEVEKLQALKAFRDIVRVDVLSSLKAPDLGGSSMTELLKIYKDRKGEDFDLCGCDVEKVKAWQEWKSKSQSSGNLLFTSFMSEVKKRRMNGVQIVSSAFIYLSGGDPFASP